MTKKIALTMCVLWIAAGGCTHNLTTLTDEMVYARTSTANVATMDAEGNLSAAYPGVGETLIFMDPDGGTWAIEPGPLGSLVANMPGGISAHILTPNDTKISRLTYNLIPSTGQTTILIEGLETNISTPLAQYVEAIKIHVAAIQGMTQAEALAAVEKWKVAKEITPTIADMLTSIIMSIIK